MVFWEAEERLVRVVVAVSLPMLSSAPAFSSAPMAIPAASWPSCRPAAAPLLLLKRCLLAYIPFFSPSILEIALFSPLPYH